MQIIDCVIYPFSIIVFYGNDKSLLSKKLKKYLFKEDIEYLKTIEFHRGKSIMFTSGQTLLWLKEEPNNPETLAILNHEIFHCVCFIMEKVGIKFSDDSDEAFAYLIEYVSKQIYKKLKKLWQ
ncbi:MAG TPA: hypothetical protein PKD00_00495 [Burkholderiales bacterium]|nr:hypothetical protein [Burkholderiales bacterium]